MPVFDQRTVELVHEELTKATDLEQLQDAAEQLADRNPTNSPIEREIGARGYGPLTNTELTEELEGQLSSRLTEQVRQAGGNLRNMPVDTLSSLHDQVEEMIDQFHLDRSHVQNLETLDREYDRYSIVSTELQRNDLSRLANACNIHRENEQARVNGPLVAAGHEPLTPEEHRQCVKVELLRRGQEALDNAATMDPNELRDLAGRIPRYASYARIDHNRDVEINAMSDALLAASQGNVATSWEDLQTQLVDVAVDREVPIRDRANSIRTAINDFEKENPVTSRRLKEFKIELLDEILDRSMAGLPAGESAREVATDFDAIRSRLKIGPSAQPVKDARQMWHDRAEQEVSYVISAEGGIEDKIEALNGLKDRKTGFGYAERTLQEATANVLGREYHQALHSGDREQLEGARGEVEQYLQGLGADTRSNPLLQRFDQAIDQAQQPTRGGALDEVARLVRRGSNTDDPAHEIREIAAEIERHREESGLDTTVLRNTIANAFLDRTETLASSPVPGADATVSVLESGERIRLLEELNELQRTPGLGLRSDSTLRDIRNDVLMKPGRYVDPDFSGILPAEVQFIHDNLFNFRAANYENLVLAAQSTGMGLNSADAHRQDWRDQVVAAGAEMERQINLTGDPVIEAAYETLLKHTPFAGRDEHIQLMLMNP